MTPSCFARRSRVAISLTCSPTIRQIDVMCAGIQGGVGDPQTFPATRETVPMAPQPPHRALEFAEPGWPGLPRDWYFQLMIICLEDGFAAHAVSTSMPRYSGQSLAPAADQNSRCPPTTSTLRGHVFTGREMFTVQLLAIPDHLTSFRLYQIFLS